jgi:Protein of unknown function (DUF4242)
MPEYVIEREVPGAGNMTEDEIREASLRSLSVLKELGSSIQWLHSYVTNDKIYCVYFSHIFQVKNEWPTFGSSMAATCTWIAL